MPRVEEVAAFIEQLAPPQLAEEWDNVGTLVDCGGEVSAVLVALDITDEVVSEAEALSCQLIVAHHPVIFRPLRRIVRGEVPYKLVRKGISAICAHTNLDAATGGVSDILGAIFGLTEPEAFAGSGRCGLLREDTTAAALAARCAERFGAPVRLADAGRPVRRLAVIGGSGGGLLDEALAAGADCLLTGEADHHDAIDARQAGLSLIAAGHFATEYPVVPVLADRLEKRFPEMKVHTSRRGRDPFAYLP